MKSKEILPPIARMSDVLFKGLRLNYKQLNNSGELKKIDFLEKYHNALESAEGEIEEKDKEIRSLTMIINGTDNAIRSIVKEREEEERRFTKSRKALEKRLEWIEQNHPDIYKQIPK